MLDSLLDRVLVWGRLWSLRFWKMRHWRTCKSHGCFFQWEPGCGLDGVSLKGVFCGWQCRYCKSGTRVLDKGGD